MRLAHNGPSVCLLTALLHVASKPVTFSLTAHDLQSHCFTQEGMALVSVRLAPLEVAFERLCFVFPGQRPVMVAFVCGRDLLLIALIN